MELCCALVGARGSVFSVKIDANESVATLKDAIQKKKKQNVLKNVDAMNLQLFLAKKDGVWLTEVDVKKGVKDTDGLTPLEDLRAKLRRVGLSEEDVRIRLTKDDVKAGKVRVHVLVAVPEGAGSQAGVTAFPSIEEFGELVEARVNKVFKDRDKKRSVPLSDLHTEHQEKMTKKMRLADSYIIVDEPTPSPNACIPPYTWLDDPESADNQRVKYMTYLETHLKGVLDEKRLSLLDVVKDQTALSISDPRLPFGMKGTTDVLLVDARSIQHREPLAGVRMVVELKKKVERCHKAKAFGVLVSASMKAPMDCTPIGLLTDLTDQWHFSWFNEKKVLTHLRIVHPKNAFDFIAAAVAEPASSKPFSVPFIGRELTKFKIDDFLPVP
ncbi:Crinkler (CRN) [Phytophthora megakarya]|uniref:Crinkler (CRN) n=1 Tax=Phytophthora megakarya TaxID=4795 RepID=A0A225USI8_9STRA|nr:Crinkler (CRN) [Phytophthora megakarya]